MKKLRIGVDFDGVVANTGELQKYLAKELFGKQIPPTCRFKNAVYPKGLTPKEYKIVSDEAYGNLKYLQHLQEQTNAQKILTSLIKKGFPIEIVTARESNEFDFAQKWLKQNRIYAPLKSTFNGEDKSFACRDLGIYIEDMPYQASALKEIVPRILLFDTYDNQKFNLTSEERMQIKGIERISDWSQFKL